MIALRQFLSDLPGTQFLGAGRGGTRQKLGGRLAWPLALLFLGIEFGVPRASLAIGEGPDSTGAAIPASGVPDSAHVHTPAAADSTPVLTPAAAADSTGASAPAAAAAADSTHVPTSSAAAADSTRRVYFPAPQIERLRDFHLEWSTAVDRHAFGSAADPVEPLGLPTLATFARLLPGVRTREISQGPGPESLALQGGSSASVDLLFAGASVVDPGISGVHSNELLMSEIAGVSVVPGGASALYGPRAASGALLADRRFPHGSDLLSRAVGEEGVDEYQRAGIQVSRYLGERGAFTVNTESRRMDGFFPGTKSVDRGISLRLDGIVGKSWQTGFSVRRMETDTRSGGVDTLEVLPVEMDRSQLAAHAYRETSPGQGALFEAEIARRETRNKADEALRRRRSTVPTFRSTIDLPRWKRMEGALRLEGSRTSRSEEREGSRADSTFAGQAIANEEYWKGAAALRWSGAFGAGMRWTETLRLDAEEARRPAFQARLEGEWAWRAIVLSGVASRNDRHADREAVRPELKETHQTYLLRTTWGRGAWKLRAQGLSSRIEHLRPDPTMEEIRAQESGESAPLGTGLLRQGTFALGVERWPIPGVEGLGRFTIQTSFDILSAELEETGDRLPLRPRWTWTGDGVLERRFFKDGLLAKLRGRLTHLHDRVDSLGNDVRDAWVTDVLLEGEIGDAAFYYRFHDLLDRADDIEPGYGLPGFSRTFGVTWRFWG